MSVEVEFYVETIRQEAQLCGGSVVWPFCRMVGPVRAVLGNDPKTSCGIC
jgi:hypothetical protein